MSLASGLLESMERLSEGIPPALEKFLRDNPDVRKRMVELMTHATDFIKPLRGSGTYERAKWVANQLAIEFPQAKPFKNKIYDLLLHNWESYPISLSWIFKKN